jgi:DNA-binding CsgD family transcriptional regulator/tetratricopeptide (TPR) repeat protein
MSTVAPEPAVELLERGETLSKLDDLLASVEAGLPGRLVWVGGEAGVGKTVLLRRFCERHGKQVRVLWGACQPLRTPRPLGPFVDVAETAGGELAELVAAAARPHQVTAALLDYLGDRRTTVLVLENLHWGDEATFDVITLIAARIASVPALVLASFRDDALELSPALRLVLGELARRPERLKIQPLSHAAVASLADPAGLDATQLYALTGGNPFFVTEVLAAGGERLPETVRDAVLARTAMLSAPARRLLEAIAVVPGEIELWLLETLVGGKLDQLDECLAAGMLRATATTVAVRHELARLALEEAISPTRRLALHRAAIESLALQEDPDFARLAHHAEATGDAEAVSRWTPRAAERAARSGAHREAATHYERALRFASGLPIAERAGLLERRAQECYLSAQIEEAMAAQKEALECYRAAGSPLREGNALRELSRILFFVGRTNEGEAAAESAVVLLEQLPLGHELALAYCNVSQRRTVVQDAEGAAEWSQRALEVAEQLNDIEALVYALTNIGIAELDSGRESGRETLERALGLAQQHRLEEHVGRIFNALTISPLRFRRLNECERYLDVGLMYCRERGLDTWRLYLLACSARLQLDYGHYDMAEDVAASVLRDPHSASVARNWALIVCGLVLARRGNAEATGCLAEAWSLAQSTDELMRMGPAAAGRAELAWLNADRAEVVEATNSALALAVERRVPWVASELSCWRWRAGIHDDLPDEILAEPYALSIRGNWSSAAERWYAFGCPYEAALALADADDEMALRQALEELQALGARPAAAIVSRRLRERGVRSIPRGPQARTAENPGGLTARELEVLALLAKGLRNAQIAERLIVSEKTIDTHVSAILRKLGARTRGEAAAQGARLGLNPQESYP